MTIDHDTATKGVIDTIAIMAANVGISDDGIVDLLQQKGYSRIDAEKLNTFVPSAFSWPIMKKLGLDNLPSYFIATSKTGAKIEIDIASQHYFTAALTLAYSTLEHGWSNTVPRKTYEIVADRSAEMNATNNALNRGGSLKGATLSPLVIERLSAEEFDL